MFRPLNPKEKACIEQVVYPYGGIRNFPVYGGSTTVKPNGDIVYFIELGGLTPCDLQAKKIGRSLKEVLGADEIYLQSVKII